MSAKKPVRNEARLIVTQCAECGVLKRRDGSWASSPLSKLLDSASVSHGLCPQCLEQALKGLDRMRLSSNSRRRFGTH